MATVMSIYTLLQMWMFIIIRLYGCIIALFKFVQNSLWILCPYKVLFRTIRCPYKVLFKTIIVLFCDIIIASSSEPFWGFLWYSQALKKVYVLGFFGDILCREHWTSSELWCSKCHYCFFLPVTLSLCAQKKAVYIYLFIYSDLSM